MYFFYCLKRNSVYDQKTRFTSSIRQTSVNVHLILNKSVLNTSIQAGCEPVMSL